ncbi:MAG: hypothetical protein CME62_03455 [Halobacteriovoraceae bacterium]|nr:hypothetical protein [Halobacteriovoraceae bacterium]
MKKIILIGLCLAFTNESFAAGQIGRLGVGMSDHLITDMKTLSLKLRRNRSSALGGNFGIDSSSEGSFYALGIKYYKLIYEEPQLNFYSTFAGNIFTYENEEEDSTEQGYQVDGMFGTEFSFQGLDSIGFSFEFGVSFYDYNDETHITTNGNNMIRSAVHFYL